MAYIDTRARWERLGLYHAVEASWGTAIVLATAFKWARELSNSDPMPTNPKNPPNFLGTGHGYDEFDHFTKGMSTMKPMTTRHPMTAIAYTDWFGLFSQNCHATTTHWYDPSGTTAAVTKSATLITKSHTSTTFSCHQGTSCLINQVGVSIPTSGECMLNLGWIGQTATIMDTTQTITSPTLDAGEALQGQDCTFSTNAAVTGTLAAAAGFSSAEITFTNGASLSACNASGLPAGANLGRANVTGTITVIDIENTTPDSACEILNAAYRADADTAASELVVEFGWNTNATALIIPTIITDRSEGQDIGGALAYTFTFKYAGGHGTWPVWWAVSPNVATSVYYTA